VPNWRKARFADYVRRNRMSWPTYADGSLDETDQTFREMAGRYPQIETLRELRYSLSKLRLNDLAVTDATGRCSEPMEPRRRGTLCVPKIRFCNIDDEDRQGQVVM
jgi:hypothetical protein